MNIGIIGHGVVGKANANGFKYLGHTVHVHDIKYDTLINDLLECDIVFLCLPTPSTNNGSCDTGIIENTIKELFLYNYNGIVAIRSTVEPGFTDTMNEKFSTLRVCFVPEFLHERSAEDDFIHNHKLLVVGTEDLDVFRSVASAHGDLPKNVKHLKPSEAEILKYFNNVYAALRVVFANIIFEICNKFDADYNDILDTYLKTEKSTGKYLNVTDNLRGYGGACLPKDTLALIAILNKYNLDFDLISSIHSDNKKFKTTVFGNMRT